MASDVASNPPNTTQADSKNARKKKATMDAVAPVAASTPADTSSQTPSNAADDGKANGTDGLNDNVYIKEMQKNVRNLTKKLNATQKVDAIIADNPGQSLDDLVALRKINADQKAQALKKPQLQAQLAQLEDQLTHYKKIDQEYQQTLVREKELLQSAHKKEIEQLKAQLKADAATELQKVIKQKYLAFSQFLRQAAAKRQEEGPDNKERQAFEGVLLLVYGGDAAAVDAIEKVVEGSNDIVNSVEDIPTGVTFAQIKEASFIDINPFSAEQAWVDDVEQARAAAELDSGATQTDPTIANAGLTELDTATTIINGNNNAADAPAAPTTGVIDTGAANAAAEEQWERAVASPEDPMGESFEIIPKNPQETENIHAPAQVTSVQSWADDAPAEPIPAVREAPAQTTNGDGFHEVHHNRGGRGRGGYHDRGSFRGRPRGDGRGRGSFRGRGDRGGPRGGFRGNRGRDGPSQ